MRSDDDDDEEEEKKEINILTFDRFKNSSL
jgi:hypothetical protein